MTTTEPLLPTRPRGQAGAGSGAPPSRGARSRQGAASPIVKIVLLLICVLWMIPTLGLLVTSFRDREAVNTSGWWTVVTRRWTSPRTTTPTTARPEATWGTPSSTASSSTVPATVIPIMIAAFAAYAFTFMRVPRP